MNDYRAIVKRSRLYPVLLLERIFPALARHVMINLGLVALLVVIGLLIPGRGSGLVVGLLLLFLSTSLALWLLELFLRSYYYGNIITNDYHPTDLFTFTAGRILARVKNGQVLPAFLTSATGRDIFRRLGIIPKEVAEFLAKDFQPTERVLTFVPAEILTLRQLISWLWLNHESWRQWLARFNLEQEDLLAATDWVVRDIENAARRKRWWSRDNLDRWPGLAEDWAYGGTYALERYSRDLTAPAAALRAAATASQETQNLIAVLARSREANALLVGATSESLLAALEELAAELKRGGRTRRRLLLFSAATFLADFAERQAFERELIKILNEAARAGNVILAIDNLAGLLQGGERMSSDVMALLDPFLTGADLQIIAFAETGVFHQVIESRQAFLTRFEKINLAEPGRERIMILLEDLAAQLSAANKITITYPALREIYRDAGQYFQTDSLADKTADLLEEAVPWALGRGRKIVDRALVQELTREKTSIPVGAIDSDEQRKLLGLEAALHARVIGQDAALRAVAGAMRRGRTEVRNPKRPIGSFLFLGPTGVGKTETAKALAAVFFGREDALLRLDMSEYQTGDALDRLIGSFTSGRPGVLSTLIRQNPYGVLLLDEFEKTDKLVRNLFLQILDEGLFSDMGGQRVNARNIIFIATSNAGAELLWQMIRAGRDPAAAKEEFINTLVGQGIYSPELLNRFDDIIIFRPLGPAELTRVAELLLKRLAERLAKQGVTFNFTPELTATVVKGGSDEVFGARPMQRYIQDKVEQRLAEAMIKGEIKSGSQITL